VLPKVPLFAYVQHQIHRADDEFATSFPWEMELPEQRPLRSEHTSQVLGRSSKLRDYCILTKPEVNLLILLTASAGYYLGSPGGFHISGWLHTLIGTLLVASGTATLNQWMEKIWDG